mmetsp:Transcript_92646/g.257683  ORF Transcript_92646/g.257683 Transcript_92646/m.257683 type:complete len:180 (-) Transcript_92646:95-634(-)
MFVAARPLATRVAAAAVRRPLPVAQFHAAPRVLAEAEGSSDGNDSLLLTFAVPDKAIVDRQAVSRVTVPGRAGTYGIQRRSPPTLSELRPGIVDVEFEGKSESERYFIPGGFAFTHANNTVDVSAPEAVRLDDIDLDLLRQKSEEARLKQEAAAPGSREEAEAKVASEVYKALQFATGA